ncbi:MAG: hypothetical protein Kilf2KO_20490 [Rhodospirillales bacterium]
MSVFDWVWEKVIGQVVDPLVAVLMRLARRSYLAFLPLFVVTLLLAGVVSLDVVVRFVTTQAKVDQSRVQEILHNILIVLIVLAAMAAVAMAWLSGRRVSGLPAHDLKSLRHLLLAVGSVGLLGTWAYSFYVLQEAGGALNPLQWRGYSAQGTGLGVFLLFLGVYFMFYFSFCAVFLKRPLRLPLQPGPVRKLIRVSSLLAGGRQ